MTFWPGFWSETTLDQHPVHEHTLRGLPALVYQGEMKVNRSRACSLHSRPRQASYGSPGPRLCLYGSPQPPLQRGSTLVRSDFTEKAARLCIAGRWSGCQVKPLASTPASSRAAWQVSKYHPNAAPSSKLRCRSVIFVAGMFNSVCREHHILTKLYLAGRI